jgi:hypothetical protein
MFLMEAVHRDVNVSYPAVGQFDGNTPGFLRRTRPTSIRYNIPSGDTVRSRSLMDCTDHIRKEQRLAPKRHEGTRGICLCNFVDNLYGQLFTYRYG